MERLTLTTERLQYLAVSPPANKVLGYRFATFREEAAMARELLELRAQVASDDVQEIPSPPLGRELGRSPIPTPRRQEREALLSIVCASCEVDTVRKAALALLGEVQP